MLSLHTRYCISLIGILFFAVILLQSPVAFANNGLHSLPVACRSDVDRDKICHFIVNMEENGRKQLEAALKKVDMESYAPFMVAFTHSLVKREIEISGRSPFSPDLHQTLKLQENNFIMILEWPL